MMGSSKAGVPPPSGALGIEEGYARSRLSAAGAHIERLEIFTPSTAMSNVTSVSSGVAKILGFGPRDGWPGWERIEDLPASERTPRPDRGNPLPDPGHRAATKPASTT